MMEFEVKPIDPKRVLIARKWSAIEYEMAKHKMTFDQFIEDRRKREMDIQKFIDSHLKQKHSAEIVKELFEGKAKIVSGEKLTKDHFDDIELVIALGGDNHMQYVSHYVKPHQLLMAVNSDYPRSFGGQEYFKAEELEGFAPNLLRGNYAVEEWPRLQATLHRVGRPPFTIWELAVSEIFVGSWARISTSRYVFPELGESHKDSGGIIALPAGMGSGSWFNSAGGNRMQDNRNLARSSKVAYYIATEVWDGSQLLSENNCRPLYPGERLEITYTHFYQGITAIDPKEKSGRNYAMKMGDKTVIEFSDKPIHVINRKDS